MLRPDFSAKLLLRCDLLEATRTSIACLVLTNAMFSFQYVFKLVCDQGGLHLLSLT